MKHAYFDCFSGVSGDMILAACLDLGVEPPRLERALAQLPLQGYRLEAQRVKRQNISGTQLKIKVYTKPPPPRPLKDIESILDRSTLPEAIKEKSRRVFHRLAQAEARIHNTSPQRVHFHEVGAVDTIIDVVGCFICLELLGIESITSSPLPLGGGEIECAHGRLPVPAPATLELLKGCPVYGTETKKELVTPTGAALISGLAREFGPMPLLKTEKIGYGAGTYDCPPRANLLRVIVGKAPAPSRETVTLTKVEADIDDMNPQLYGWIMERLFAAGALDVTMTPVYMKKNRPGVRLCVFTSPAKLSSLAEIILAETTTIGLRFSQVEKMRLPRRARVIDTPRGKVSIKISLLPDGKIKFKPEYEDCRNIALREGVPIDEVYREVEKTAQAALENYNFLEEAKK